MSETTCLYCGSDKCRCRYRAGRKGIGAPIPDDEDRREFLATLKDASPAVLKAIAAFHRKRAMVAEAKCARLEAEKQDAQTALRDMIRSARPNRKEHPTMYAAWRNAEIVLGEFEDDIRESKPTAAKQGDAS